MRPLPLYLQIYGLFLVKLAVAITLIGGCPRRDDSGTHIRGECHMLLIGDPGTGKSQVRPPAALLFDAYGVWFNTEAVYDLGNAVPREELHLVL
jgi:hypothetical protein